MTYIIDSHEDLACSALSFNRDYCLSASDIRKSEVGTSYPLWNNGEATLGWPDYQAGKVALIFATLFIAPAAYSGGAWDLMAYRTLKEGAQLWQNQLDYYNRLANDHPDKSQLVLNPVLLLKHLQDSSGNRTDKETVKSQEKKIFAR